jgi:DHA1 family bicyclomycin/chloramphenicol resistance-like MFS transporter
MPRSSHSGLLIILILGALSTVSPFSIDMYLPAFPQIAHDLGTTPAQISLSVSGYFIGLALGQLFYGPMLDRFGRKRPLYAGLGLFTVASFGCIAAPTPGVFIAFRLLQALGGCVAQVGSIAMVRDFFPARESAKILSLLLLVLSVSPLFAPSIGSLIATTVGWPWIFVFLAAFAVLLMVVIRFLLPEAHQGDRAISLLPRAVLEGFHQILVRPQFYTYAIGGAFAFAGLFVYVAGSPIIFIDGFHLGPNAYGLIFAALACAVIMLILVVGTFNGWYGLAGNIVLLLLYLPFCGIAYPNAAAIALAPFSKNVGSASAVLGFLQMGIGALASTGVGLLNATSSLMVFVVMAATAFIGLVILLANHRRVLIVRAGEA